MSQSNPACASPARRILTKVPVLLSAFAAIALIGATSASAGSGGLGAGTTSGGGGNGGKESKSGNLNLTPPKYKRHWNRVGKRDKRWAKRVGYCESGNDPDMTALNGRYRGAFMFTRDAWKTSPKTPGGDPVDYSWKTQAVVAVALKKRDGTRPWPVCG
jgi:hypothetical protein